MPLTDIAHILLVLSGKGGVGKSSVTTQLALTLSLQGFSVGVLDVDLTGPSMPRFLGVEGQKVTQAPGGLLPVSVHPRRTATASTHNGGKATEESTAAQNGATENGASQNGQSPVVTTFGPLSCLSLGFILASKDAAVIWRGPKKTAMVRQFLTSTIWPAGLDYLLIDTPPGTSDEHIALVETLLQSATPAQLAGAVVVTTPQAIATADVRKELNFCVKTGVRVRGVVENMAGFVCPHCSLCTNVFSKGGGEVMAREFGVPFLGSVPIDPAFVELIETGRRPRYPGGTVVAGRDVSSGGVEAADGSSAGDDKDLLVEKYTSCSLHTIFDGMVRRLVDDINAS